MKKIGKILGIMLVFAVVVICSVKTAYAAGASLDGPGTVRAGDTITLKLNVNDSGKYGLEGELSYNSSQVTLSDVSTGMKGWKVEREGNKLVVYDDNLSNPISGTKAVITLKFKVSGSVKAGDKLDIAVNNVVATDGTNESSYGAVKYSVAIAQPLSTNANLSALSIDGVTLSPAFAAGTTKYDAGQVEYSTSTVKVKYTTEDAKSKVSVKGTTLSVGKNTVTVTVIAESGDKKNYTITITRKQDPNYVASSDATLKSLSVNNGSISPAFAKDVTEYIVYLPYENVGKAVTATGAANDSKASGITDGTVASLVEGANKLSVVCKAEDGTEKAYNITVVVMPKYSGTVPKIEGVEEETTTEPPTEPPTEEDETITSTEESTTQTSQNVEIVKNPEPKSTSPVLIIVLVIVGVGVGFGGCFLLFKKNILR